MRIFLALITIILCCTLSSGPLHAGEGDFSITVNRMKLSSLIDLFVELGETRIELAQNLRQIPLHPTTVQGKSPLDALGKLLALKGLVLEEVDGDLRVGALLGPDSSREMSPSARLYGLRLAALVTSGDKGQSAYFSTNLSDDFIVARVGEEIVPGINLSRVLGDRVEIETIQGIETIYLIAPPRHNLNRWALEKFYAEGVKKAPGLSWEIKRETFSKIIEEGKPHSSNQHVLPHLGSDGGQDGMLLSAIRPRSFLELIGLKTSDVVTEINGIPLTGVARIFRALDSLESREVNTVNLTRKGKKLQHTYLIR